MTKRILAWLTLIILCIATFILTVIKTTTPNNNINEVPTNTEMSKAVNKALTDITNNFNTNEKINDYKDKNIKISSFLKNHSIYITYEDKQTTTYELNYNNLILTIIIENSEDNVKQFNQIQEILIAAIQKRLNNDSLNDEQINAIITGKIQTKGYQKIEEENTTTYKFDITKKIEGGE